MTFIFALGIVATNAWLLFAAFRGWDKFKKEQTHRFNEFEIRIFKLVNKQISEMRDTMGTSFADFRKELFKKKVKPKSN